MLVHGRWLVPVVAALIVAALLVGPPSDPATADTGAASPPAAERLDDGWFRAPDPGDDGLSVGRHRGEGPGRVPVTVPDVTDASLTARGYRGGVWWYDRRITVPSAPSGGSWALRFDAVRRTANVYADGRAIGASDDPYSPFEVLIPEDMNGRTITVAVRVDGRRPAPLSEGWWNWTGITRPVHLVPRGRLHASEPAVQGNAACRPDGHCEGSVRVRASVLNRTTAPFSGGRARLTVQDAQGKELAVAEQHLGALVGRAEAQLRLDVPVPGGALWTPASPVLHRATLELIAPSGRVEQRVVRRVGLRQVTVEGGRLKLNGHTLRLRGSSIQEDIPGRGAAMTDADIARTVGELQASGANVTRAHYSLDERLLTALDEAGIMVWAQSPVYQADRRLRTETGFNQALRSNRRAIVATRNHPSVIVHSVANELAANPDVRPASRIYLAEALRAATELDPTVPPAIDLRSLPGYDAQAAYGAFPVLGLNVYFGWYSGPRKHSVKRLGDLAPFLERTRRQYPSQAIAITEMGAEGVRRGARGVKGTREFQARYLSRVLNVLNDRTDLSGAIYWTLREFGIKPKWTGGTPRKQAKRDGLHRKGLLSYHGSPKPVWKVALSRLNGSVWADGAPARSLGPVGR
ncbi:MAG: glycoside hydrolase family 2 protein [Solirubrobacteraceae bacterium]